MSENILLVVETMVVAVLVVIVCCHMRNNAEDRRRSKVNFQRLDDNAKYYADRQIVNNLKESLNALEAQHLALVRYLGVSYEIEHEEGYVKLNDAGEEDESES